MAKEQKNSTLAFVCLLLLYIVILYSNTLQVPFMLDDRVNIVQRPNLHLSQFTIENITKTFFKPGENGKKLYRPITCLSLGLNYYIGKFNVTGYHIVNVIIHLFTSFFLFKVIQLLLQLKNFNFKNNQINQIAGFATILWAAHPIQTQAVTYIVQRMASLSAMFYILGLWSFINLRTRINLDRSKKVKWLLISVFFFLCAVLSKENAVLFPLGIFAIELFFFNGYERIKKNPVIFICIACILLLVPLVFFFHTTDFEKILSAYDHRPYNITQRLLTEPRILFFYLSQIFYPVPGRFSISHSFILSDSLFFPLSTILSIVGIGLLFLFALLKGKKYPLVGFPIVFYFTHHLVESTIIPLELVFEHRNYLPSFFIFLPVSYGLVKLLTFYKKQNKAMFLLISLFCVSIIFLFGLSTHTRNKDWQTHESLWETATKTSPDLIRPYAQLGWYHTSSNRLNTSKARHYFKLGLNKEESYSVFEKAMLWLNIAKSYEHENNIIEAQKALLTCLDVIEREAEKKPQLLNKNITIQYLSSVNYYLANMNYYLKDTAKAIFYIERALGYEEKPAFDNAKAKFLIHNKNQSQAIKFLQHSLKKDRGNWNTYFLLGNALTNTGHYSQGLWFYKQAQNTANRYHNPQSYIEFYIADNLYLSGRPDAADTYLTSHLTSNSIKKTINFIKVYQGQYLEYLPLTNSKKIFLKFQEGIHSLIRKTKKI